MEKLKYLLLAGVICLADSGARAQDNLWNGKKCAVVLTYDDALNVHLDKALPALDSLGLKATFYLSGYFPGCKERLDDWRKAAAQGHELANHTLFHPCTGKVKGREWVKPDYDLGNYTLRRLVDEIRMTNILLEAIDGKKKRTFAYPCADTRVGDSSYVYKIHDDFEAARGVKSEIQKMDDVDLYNINSFAINGESGDEMIRLVTKARDRRGLIVFLFHGVGGEHSINVNLGSHSQLLHFLKQNEKDIWIAPLIDVAAFVRENKKR